MEPYYRDEYVTLYCGDCIEIMPDLTMTFDACITDPPYEYIQTLEWDKKGFDKNVFVDCIVGVLAQNSMVAMFGRGSSFYRINCLFEDAGLKFKEEIIWNKRQGTSPCMPLQRVHETISIFSKGNAKIIKTRVPYLEKKQYNIGSICQDVKRLSSALKNPKELAEMLNFLEQNGKVNIYNINERTHKYKISQQDTKSAQMGVAALAQIKNGMSESSILRTDMNLKHTWKHETATRKDIKAGSRPISTLQSITFGMDEASIIRTDRSQSPFMSKHNVTLPNDTKSGNRAINTLQAVSFGMKETSIFEEGREHYKMKHPTQKPVRLIERLLNIISRQSSLVIDPFAGSGTTGVACMNTGRKCVLIEKEEKYCEIAARRLSQGVLPLWEQEVE